MFAITNAHIETAKLLLERGAKINKSDHLKWTSLLIVTTLNKIELVRFLEENGANIDQTNNIGWTPLILACEKGFAEIANFLLEKGADIHKKTNAGTTALELATRYHHDEIVIMIHDAMMLHELAHDTIKAYKKKCSITKGQAKQLVDQLYKNLYQRIYVIKDCFSNKEQRLAFINGLVEELLKVKGHITATTFDVVLMQNSKLFLLGCIVAKSELPSDIFQRIVNYLPAFKNNPFLISNGYKMGLRRNLNENLLIQDMKSLSFSP
jgi:hypothetical protein